MNRRDVLKGIAAMPLAGALSCKSEEKQSGRADSPNMKARTLQILLEGAFAVVLQKGKPNRLVAFVPSANSGDTDLMHNFYFNDPSRHKPPVSKDPAGYQFELSANGLRTAAEPYINPGFSDFLASTDKWRLPPRIVTIVLPFPDSINFGGRPLNVIFKNGNRRGVMPTNHLIEYYIDDPAKVKLTCSGLGGACQPTPNCPPGVLRFFFGTAPKMEDEKKRREHAVKFFNFILHTSFPDLEERYSLADIYSPDRGEEGNTGYGRPTAKSTETNGLLVPAMLPQPFNHARLLPVSETVDCQTGGILVRTAAAPMP